MIYTIWWCRSLIDSRAAFEKDRKERDEIAPTLIRQELARILESRYFRQSKRAKQFLQFVVEQKIGGNEEQLKERLIGIEVFGRGLDYATGDDPVVRVQAGEVRRRLELYQADVDDQQQVSIELPVGSYVPIFHLRIPDVIPSHTPALDNGQKFNPEANESLDVLPAAPELRPSLLYLSDKCSTDPSTTPSKKRVRRIVIGICICLALAVVVMEYGIRNTNSPDVWMNAFWGPVTGVGKPVLICLVKPAVYQPSRALFDSYAAKHSGAFATPLERYTRVLPLAPQETIRWSDMVPVYNSGPAIGGVHAAMNISALFGRRNMPFEVRFGDEVSFTELRESPAVIIGALNNRWMMQMSSDLHFVMQETKRQLSIHETGPANRTWVDQNIPAGWRDYGLVTRQLKGPTGQITIRIEGISDGGTQAGSELISNPRDLRNALQNLPKGWERKNIQLVVATDIIEGKPGPPQLVAFYVW